MPQVAALLTRFARRSAASYALSGEGYESKTLYRHQKTVPGYGIKVWPEDYATLKTKAPETESLEGLLN